MMKKKTCFGRHFKVNHSTPRRVLISIVVNPILEAATVRSDYDANAAATPVTFRAASSDANASPGANWPTLLPLSLNRHFSLSSGILAATSISNIHRRRRLTPGV